MQEDLAVERVRRVYEAESERLWRSLFAFCGSRSVADDAVAEAFAQALRRGDRIDDVAAWVWTSAFAIARGELKRRGRTTGDSLANQRTGDIADDDGDVQHLLQRLAALSHDDRELIVLCHVGGWKPRELAPIITNDAGDGWEMIDTLTGDTVDESQRWNGIEPFEQQCCGDSAYVWVGRDGGVVFAVNTDRIRVWYPQDRTDATIAASLMD